MRNIMNRAMAVLRAAAPWALGAALALWMAAVLLAGGTLPGLLAAAALFAAAVLGVGLLLAGRLMPALGMAERTVCAFPLGCTVLFGLWALLCATPLRTAAGPAAVYLCLPAGVWGLYRALPAARAAARKAPAGLYWAAALFGALYVFYGLLPMALPERLRVWTYQQDFLWSIGNAASVRFGLPLEDIRAAGLPIYYHFLNDAVAGLLAWAGGTTAWAELAFYWYMPVGLLYVLALWALARRLGCTPGLAVLAAACVLFAPGQGSGMPFQIFTNINGMGGALLCLCAVLLAAAHLPQQAAQSRAAALRWMGGIFLCCLGLSLYKSTLGMLAACGLLAAAAAGLVRRGTVRRHLYELAAGVLALAAFGLCWALLYRRAVNNLAFTGAERLPQLPADVWSASALGAVCYLAALPYYLRRFRRLDFAALAVNALALGGVLAYGLYTHYSSSQVYFLLAAVPMWWAAALPALAGYARRLGAARHSAVCAAAGAVCALVLTAGTLELLPGCRSGAQAAAQCMGLRTGSVTAESILAGEAAAAAWLRENTPSDAVFACNRNDRQPAAGDGTFHFFTAAAQRRCYVESYRYAFDYTNQYHEVRRRLEQVSDAIYRDLPEDEAFALAAAEGIDYLLVSRQAVNVPDWQRPPVFQNADCAVWAVDGG